MDREELPADALRVEVTSSQRCTYDYHDGEQYGDWRQSHDFEVEGARVVPESYEDRSYRSDIFRVPAGSTNVYVLYMIYSTGDSFGHSDGEGTVLGCFGNRDVAFAAKEAVEKQSDDFTIVVKDDFGRAVSISNPGAGYFEHIDRIDIKVFAI